MQRRTALWLICCFSHGLIQIGFSQEPQQPPPAPATYLAFLRQVLWLKQQPVLLNGQPTALIYLTIQEYIGLNDPETQILNEVAADCEAKIRPIDESVRSATFEARLHSIQSEGSSEWLAQRLSGLNNQLDRIVRDQVQQLKHDLGDSRFEILDKYVRSKKDEKSFFPPVTSQPVVRRLR
jgi:hypothetical protein